MRRLTTYALSSVIAMVIIIAITIAVAIATTLWVAGITGIYTKVETLQVVNKYASGSMSEEGWRGSISLTVRNSGSFDLSITNVLINGRSYMYFGNVNGGLPVLLRSGETKTLTLTIDRGDLASGTTVEVVLHTSTGTEYYQAVNIPLQLT